jgi:hypothetical protein
MYTLLAIFTLGVNQQPPVIIPNLTHEACQLAARNMLATGRTWDVKPMCLQQGAITPLSVER